MRKIVIYMLMLLLTGSLIAEIAVYNKSIINEKCLIFADINLKIILGELKKNDEVKIVKIINKNGQLLYVIEDEFGKRGVIAPNNFSEEKEYLKKIVFIETSYSDLLYDFKYKTIFKKIQNGEEFEIESEPKSEDGQFFYYRNSLGFVIRLSKKDKYIISDNKKENEKGSEVNENKKSITEGAIINN